MESIVVVPGVVCTTQNLLIELSCLRIVNQKNSFWEIMFNPFSIKNVFELLYFRTNYNYINNVWVEEDSWKFLLFIKLWKISFNVLMERKVHTIQLNKRRRKTTTANPFSTIKRLRSKKKREKINEEELKDWNKLDALSLSLWVKYKLQVFVN